MEYDIGLTGLWWAPLRFSVEAEALEVRPARCPSCWSRDCAAGLPVSRADRFYLRHDRVPFECRACGRHFRLFDPAEAAALLDAQREKIMASQPRAPRTTTDWVKSSRPD